MKKRTLHTSHRSSIAAVPRKSSSLKPAIDLFAAPLPPRHVTQRAAGQKVGHRSPATRPGVSAFQNSALPQDKNKKIEQLHLRFDISSRRSLISGSQTGEKHMIGSCLAAPGFCLFISQGEKNGGNFVVGRKTQVAVNACKRKTHRSRL